MDNHPPPPKTKIVRGSDGKLRTVDDVPTVTEADLARTRREVHEAIHGHVPFHDDPMAKPEEPRADEALPPLFHTYTDVRFVEPYKWPPSDDRVEKPMASAAEIRSLPSHPLFRRKPLEWLVELLYVEFKNSACSVTRDYDEQAGDECPSIRGALYWIVANDEP